MIPEPDTPNLESQWEMYREQLASAREDERSSSDELDKNLITLSSGALGLSIAFIKDIVHLPQATWLWLLITSWALLTTAILSTLISFICSGQALKIHSQHLYKYYIERNDDYFDKRSAWSVGISWCSWISATAFILGVVATIVFVSVNVIGGHNAMSEDKKFRITANDARPLPRMTPIVEGRQAGAMTQIPSETRGRQPQSMTPIPTQIVKPQTIVVKPQSGTGKDDK